MPGVCGCIRGVLNWAQDSHRASDQCRAKPSGCYAILQQVCMAVDVVSDVI
jgi:hypothetical protein